MNVSLPSALALACLTTAASGAGLMIDFNVAGTPLNLTEAGYQAYEATHEANPTNPAHVQFTTQNYNATFLQTGAANVSLTPSWSNTTAFTVQQMINRSDAQAGSWLGLNGNLLRDWIGIDARAASGGNGPNPTGANPTYMLLTLGGLPAGSYDWLSYHHDVENMNSNFQIEVSVNGGVSYVLAATGRMTNSLAGGTPAENEILGGTAPNVAGGSPDDLSSTQRLQFTASGTDDVILRFSGIYSDDAATHQTFFGVNGFQLDQVPEPSAAAVSLLGAAALGLRRRRS